MNSKTASAPPLESSQPATGVPFTTVQGQGHVPFDQSTATFFPADLQSPTFLGATVGHAPIMMTCGRCGYTGPSLLKKKKGMANVMTALVFFGIGYFLPVDDTHHYCPQCDHHVAVAKVA